MKKVRKIKVKKDDGLNLKMVNTKHRKYLEFNFEFEEGTKKISDRIIKKLEKVVVGDTIVQINIKIWEGDIHELNVDHIYEFLEPQYPFYIRPIIPMIQKQKSLRNAEITADLEPEEAIKLFIEAMNPEDAEEIEKLALDIFRGVEIEC